MVKVKVDEKARTITIVADMETPQPSKSGKTIIIASTHGNIRTDQLVDGKPLTVSLNAYIPR